MALDKKHKFDYLLNDIAQDQGAINRMNAQYDPPLHPHIYDDCGSGWTLRCAGVDEFDLPRGLHHSRHHHHSEDNETEEHSHLTFPYCFGRTESDRQVHFASKAKN